MENHLAYTKFGFSLQWCTGKQVVIKAKSITCEMTSLGKKR